MRKDNEDPIALKRAVSVKINELKLKGSRATANNLSFWSKFQKPTTALNADSQAVNNKSLGNTFD